MSNHSASGTNVVALRAAKGTAAAASAPSPAPSQAPSQAPRAVPSRHRALFVDPNEGRRRKATAWVAGFFTLTFLALTIFNAVYERALIPIPFGSGLLIEAAVAIAPEHWVVAALHNGCLALLSLTVLVCCTTAHTEPPGDPRSPHVVFRRRQVRFSAPSVLAAGILLWTGIHVSNSGYPVLGGLVQSLAAGFALRAAVIWLVPIALKFIVVERDPARGVGTRITFGGGWDNWRKGARRYFHEDVIKAEKISGVLESCVGLATLRVWVNEEDGSIGTIDTPRCASQELVQQFAYYLCGDFQLGQTFATKGLIDGYNNVVTTKATATTSGIKAP